MSAHTVGPWGEHSSFPIDTPVQHIGGVGCDFDSWVGVIATGDKIIGNIEMRARAGGFPQVEDLDEAKANWRLCCAAPDLLEALKKAAKFIAFVERTKATSGAPFGLEQEIEDAIAKASPAPSTQEVSK